MAIRLERLLDLPSGTLLTLRGRSQPTHQFVGWLQNSIGKTMQLRVLQGIWVGKVQFYAWPDRAFPDFPELLCFLKPEFKLNPATGFWPVDEWAKVPEQVREKYKSMGFAMPVICPVSSAPNLQQMPKVDLTVDVKPANWWEGTPGPELRQTAKLRALAEAYGDMPQGYWEMQATQRQTDADQAALILARSKQVAAGLLKDPTFSLERCCATGAGYLSYHASRYPPFDAQQVYDLLMIEKQSLIDNPAQVPQTPNKETNTMITITTKTLANGQDLDTLSAGAIYDMIAAEEAKIAKLDSIKRKPKMLTKEIADREAGIAALVAYLDAKQKD